MRQVLIVLLASISFLFTALPAASGYEARAVEVCSVWKEARPVNSSQQTFRAEANILCFVGDTTPESSAAFVAELAEIDSDEPLTVVVDSLGGEVNAGMSMGEALVPRTTTIVVNGICASSCANYLFLAADYRVISTNSLLVFHGGVVAMDRDVLRASLENQVPVEHIESSIRDVERQIDVQIDRQDAFLKSTQGDVNFFRWMAGVFATAESDRSEFCSIQTADAVVFSDRILAEHNIVVDENRGAKSNLEIAEALAEYGLSRRLCFVDAL